VGARGEKKTKEATDNKFYVGHRPIYTKLGIFQKENISIKSFTYEPTQLLKANYIVSTKREQNEIHPTKT
jgi:hypothetical protein